MNCEMKMQGAEQSGIRINDENGDVCGLVLYL
ncbi:hypothetical protein DJ39_3372 [Yersinia ruckeri ATCC 29473]|nr:hypothetical protein DJ39_3372 [Yersinia ruckeri ATCC 29473]